MTDSIESETEWVFKHTQFCRKKYDMIRDYSRRKDIPMRLLLDLCLVEGIKALDRNGFIKPNESEIG